MRNSEGDHTRRRVFRRAPSPFGDRNHGQTCDPTHPFPKPARTTATSTLATLLLCATLSKASEPLLNAVYTDNFTTATKLIESGENPAEPNRYGVTPLSIACQNGNPAMAKLLLEAKADPNTKLQGGETPLMTAARTGNPECVKLLLEHGAQINAKERSGQTALMWAAAEGHAEVVKLLLEHEADLKTSLESGFTAMLFAVRAGHAPVVRLFLKAGSDVSETARVDRRDGRSMRDHTSPLMLAIVNGHLELALELVDAGADPNDIRTGFAPLHAISWVRKSPSGDGPDGIPPPTVSGKITGTRFVAEMVKRGADVDIRQTAGGGGGANLNLKGATPFLMAAATDDLPLLEALTQAGADPTLTNSSGTTPLMAAAGVGISAPGEDAGSEDEAVETVKYLLELGADINAVDQRGETAMHGAAYKGVAKVIRLLDERGADISFWNRKNKQGWTPLLIAQGFRFGNFRPIKETREALTEIMKSHGVEIPPERDRKK